MMAEIKYSLTSQGAIDLAGDLVSKAAQARASGDDQLAFEYMSNAYMTLLRELVEASLVIDS